MVQYRKYGAIPTLKRKLTARRFLFFDTETATTFQSGHYKRLEFRLGVAKYVEFNKDYQEATSRLYRFQDRGEFVEILRDCLVGRGTLYAIAHNIQFDIQILDLPYVLHEAGFTLELPILSWTSSLWTTHLDGKAIRFMDSMNIFPGKLEALGKDLKLPKLAIDPLTAPLDATFRYCQRDVDILFAAFAKWLRFLYEHKLGYFCETIAWQAMTAYRTRFMEHEIIAHTDYVALDYERKAYHGARCECFFIGKRDDGPFYLLDVNSEYGYVMANNEYPAELLEVRVNVKPSELAKLLEEFYVIAECEVDTNDATYPYRGRAKLVFPVGRYATSLHSPELDYALRHNQLRGSQYALVYRRAALFSSYAGFFSGLKADAVRSGDKLTERLVKMLLNALSGKLGQHNNATFYLGKSNHSGVKSYVCRLGRQPYTFNQTHFFGKVYETVQSGEKPYSMPSIAGAITAYGRMYLWSIIQLAKPENVFYCDTDSVIVNQQGYEALASLMDPHQIGALKVVKVSQSLEINGMKDYKLDDLRRQRGTPLAATYGPHGEVTFEEFQSMQNSLSKNERGFVSVREVTKQPRKRYSKGSILDDGRVVPFVLPGDENEALG